MPDHADNIYGNQPEHWQLATFGNLIDDGIAELQTGPFGTALAASEYRPIGTPVIAVQHIADNRIAHSSLPRVDTATRDRLARYELRTGDILFARKGAVERRALVRAEEDGWLQGSDCIRLRLDPSSISPVYISYALGTPQYRNWIIQNAHGATMPSLNQEILRRVPVPLPSLDEQRAIASILGALDDKIELNRRMNATLEAMARAIFQSWFVDFDPVRAKAEGRETGLPAEIAALFPDGFVESGNVRRPSTWHQGQLSDLLVLQRGLDLPSSSRVEGPYPVMAASGPSGTHNEYAVKGPGVTTGRSGVLGKVFLVQDDFWPLNTSLWVKEFRISRPYHAYFLLKTLDFATYNAGSAVPTLNRNHVHNLPVALPPVELIKYFEVHVDPLLRHIRGSEAQISTLSILRDTLLPKLVSGQLRVPEAEDLLEEPAA